VAALLEALVVVNFDARIAARAAALARIPQEIGDRGASEA
jgi:hypothetical protein